MTTQPQSRPALFAGENPIVRLVRPGTDQFVAVASYWRATYSPEGEGSVLLTWGDPAASVVVPHAIYSDNIALARMVTEKFNQYFSGFTEHGFGSLEPQAGRFAVTGDGRGALGVSCVAGGTTIDLIWSDPVDSFQSRSRSTLGGRDYDICNVMCPVATASITVNSAGVAGEVLRKSERESSAFLAFAESWTDA